MHPMLARLLAGLATLALSFAFVAPRAAVAQSRLSDATPPFEPMRVVRAFPPIVDAPYISGRDVDDEVTAKELVIGVVVNGEARAYPINMLTGPSREIINDHLGGVAIAATW
ncbi:DUF3179 domain-containing protein [Candidatus Poribacteria bacterium]|jgi:hypothetical protein|nr:DUF3179 domain-containing protein [Candidatus Poribacteria bacterium]MBT5532155.1 DUF3179 domain-containing protein [Candidatus Poribacteria bacterium]MBT5710514.1 DUF3179 domain-containing protein [Candidatus Poribacteria bacterium]MBT7099477.1 DUF3179 domain-containing protein [Candidatus Poribacteria bacterium]MBT7806492.1 DUF3179 domain-containing protein [Candidatus Poribacteria bacterium]